MQRYWDLSERERAALTREQVEELTKVELMEQGVLRVEPLELEPEPMSPNIRRSTFYCVDGNIAFATLEQARAFLELKPLHVGNCYFGNDYSSRIPVARPVSTQIELIELASQEDVDAARALLERAAEVRKLNRARKEEHETATRAQDEALSQLWADWGSVQQKDLRMRRVVATFNEYEELAGDTATAVRFLLKAFPREEVTEAAAWCGVDIPLPEPAEGFASASAPEPQPSDSVF